MDRFEGWVYEHRILALSKKVALIYAGLHIAHPKSVRDAWISATAIQASLTLVTRNVSDFANMDVELINPFEP